MPLDGTTLVQARHLAHQIERDIVRRGLRAGDKYLSTRSVATFFGVSLSAAAQTMQELTERDILCRRDRSGTYVGAALRPDERHPLRSVGIILPEQRAEYANISLDALIHAIRHRNPGLSVHITFLPAREEMPFLRNLLEAPHMSAKQTIGVVPISCSREVYHYIRQVGLPMVVLGTPDPDLQDLPHVDVDAFEAGRLLAKHLMDRGHSRLALFTPSGGREGDNAFHEGVLDAMAAAAVPPNALVSRITSHGLELFRAQIVSVFRREDAPTGIICRADRMVDTLLDALAGLGLQLEKDYEVVYEQSMVATHRRLLGLTYVYTRMSLEDVCDRVAERLLSQIGAASSPEPFIIPVELGREPIGGA